MRLKYKAAMGVGALLAGAATMVIGGAGSASAATATTVHMDMCNSTPGAGFQLIFPQISLTTRVVPPAGGGGPICLSPSHGFTSGEPFIVRVRKDGVYKDLAGYVVANCFEQVTVGGTYDNPTVSLACL